jgi:hypothetical protein
LATIAGPAMAKTCAEVTREGRLNARRPAGPYLPRGALKIRDSTQIGITMTAPSRK